MNKEQNINYSSTVSLTPDDNNRFQVVYASQRYGTFFGVFAKFKIRKAGDQTLLDQVDFELINFKGPVNISLVKIAIDTEARERIRDVDLILAKLDFQQAMGLAVTERSFSFANPIEIKKDSYFSIISDLLPLSGGHDTKVAFVNGFFDSEYFYRDGLAAHPREVTSIPLGQTPSKDEGFDFETTIKFPQTIFGSIRCRVGNAKIII